MKKIKFNLLAIIGMMVAVGTVAFTSIQKNAAPIDGWYEVSLIDPGGSATPENQEIRSLASTPSNDGSGCSSEFNDGLTCAIHLTFDGTLEVPATVEDAISEPTIEVGDEAKMPEE